MPALVKKKTYKQIELREILFDILNKMSYGIFQNFFNNLVRSRNPQLRSCLYPLVSVPCHYPSSYKSLIVSRLINYFKTHLIIRPLQSVSMYIMRIYI